MVHFNTGANHVCPRCTLAFWSSNRKQVYCSRQCSYGAKYGCSEVCYNCGQPTQDGHLYCSAKCNRLYTKRIAQRRKKLNV